MSTRQVDIGQIQRRAYKLVYTRTTVKSTTDRREKKKTSMNRGMPPSRPMSSRSLLLRLGKVLAHGTAALRIPWGLPSRRRASRSSWRALERSHGSRTRPQGRVIGVRKEFLFLESVVPDQLPLGLRLRMRHLGRHGREARSAITPSPSGHSW
jgi:hypothetical protein